MVRLLSFIDPQNNKSWPESAGEFLTTWMMVDFIPTVTLCLCKTVHRHTAQKRRNSFYERTDEAS